jgi:carnitine-CoA ligase
MGIAAAGTQYGSFIPAIPKTASEKPQERFLVEMFNSGEATIHTIQGEKT